MNWHKLITVLLLFLSLSFCEPTPGQEASSALSPFVAEHVPDFNKTVVPITELKVDAGLNLEARSGTGFCLDPTCLFIVTTYHVAMIAYPRKIRGEKVIQRYLATGPDEQDATMQQIPGMRPQKFNLSRDLAIFELRQPLRQYKGITFSLQDLLIGEEVCIYAFPKESHNLIRSLVKYHGTFKGETPAGLLAFDYSLSAGKEILSGASGGIVVDCKTQYIVGLLSGVEKHGAAVALAVPVQVLADFVSKVQPFLAPILFPSATKTISPVSADLYSKFVQPLAATTEHRTEESADIKMLRSKAQLLADSMGNFIAVQTFDWGSANNAPAAMAAYEVRVLDGFQRFRKYPDGDKEFQDVPFPPLNTAVSTAGEWSELPNMVGTELRLKIHQAPNVVFHGRSMKVFQYRAAAEDDLCKFKSVFDFGFFAFSKIATIGCYGEVWTDMDSNILRMSKHFELLGKWREYQAVVIYGWLERKDETPVRIPLTIATQAEFNKKLYWCRGMFTNYQMFTSQVRMVAN
jgi:hypothetical protein